MKKVLGSLLALSAFAAAKPAQAAVTIGFDDLVSGTAVAGQYSALGVTFSNAQTRDFGPVPGGSAPNVLIPILNDGYFTNYGSSHSIVAVFANSPSFVSVDALDVGSAGFRLEALDALSNIVDFEEIANDGVGAGLVNTLTVSGLGISRVRLFQIGDGFALADGVLVDNFSFDVKAGVPEPSTWLMMIIGFAAIGFAMRRHRDATGPLQLRLMLAIGREVVREPFLADMAGPVPSARGDGRAVPPMVH